MGVKAIYPEVAVSSPITVFCADLHYRVVPLCDRSFLQPPQRNVAGDRRFCRLGELSASLRFRRFLSFALFQFALCVVQRRLQLLDRAGISALPKLRFSWTGLLPGRVADSVDCTCYCLHRKLEMVDR